jgi:hypothetical protein
MFPYTGHMTVRYAMPTIETVDPLDLIVDDLADILDNLETTTTPKVAVAAGAGETVAGKGGQAR